MRSTVAAVLMGLLIAAGASTTEAEEQAKPQAPIAELPQGGRTTVPAPAGTTSDVLGMGASERFSDKDAQGRTIRVFPAVYRSATDNRTHQKYRLIENEFELGASSAFTLGQGKGTLRADQRYLTWSVYHVSHVDTLERTTPPQAEAPLVAVRVFHGWAHHLVVAGDRANFTAELATLVRRAMTQGEPQLKALIESRHLQIERVAVGLETPKAQMEYLTDPEQVERHFKPSAKPEPIFIEYEAMRPTKLASLKWERTPLVPGDWRIDSVAISIARRKADGNPWDADDEFPDPFVKVLINGRQVDHLFRPDVFELEYSPRKVVNLDEVVSLRVVVADRDLLFDDFVGRAELSLLLPSEGLYADQDLVLRTTDSLRTATIRFAPVK